MVPKRDQKKAPSSNKQKKAQLRLQNAAHRRRRLAAEGRLVLGHEVPPGAIAANPSKQTQSNSYATKFFYVDQEFTCVGCGVDKVWTATQQKWYYEVAGGSIYGEAKRCRACRRRRRDELARQRHLLAAAKQKKAGGQPQFPSRKSR
jgi:hypothetical protein